MEKKETIAGHRPIGVCEKLYNAFINRPFLIPLHRPRLTSGRNPAEEQAPNTKSRPSVIAKGEEKVASAINRAPANIPPAVIPPLKKENLDTKPTNPTLPHRLQPNLKDTSNAQLSGKPSTREFLASEREKLSTLMQQRSEKQQPAPAPPFVPASTLAAASQGKTAASFVPKAPIEKEKAAVPSALPSTPYITLKKPTEKDKAAPTSSPEVLPTVAAEISKAAAQAVTKAETGKEKAVAALSSIGEKAGKAAPPARAATKGNEMPEGFLKRARDSIRGVGSANVVAQNQK